MAPVTTSLPASAERTPGRLSEAQRRTYDEDGFVIVPDVFSTGDLQALDGEVDRLLPDHEDRAGHRPGWILGVGTCSDLAKAVAKDERILALIEDIVQPGIAIHSAKLVAKVPGSDIECHWHQDEAFYRRPADASTHSRTRMSVWVPLQDADERNGCLWVVPGSHRWGLQPFVQVEYGQCRRKLTKEEYANEHAVPVSVSAGSVVLFSAWTWHHSKTNHTDRVRRAFIVSYQEATIGQGAAAEWRILRPATEAANA